MNTKNLLRLEQMNTLRNQGYTLKNIGQRYGISRERVRQILGNTGKKFRFRLAEEYIKEHNLRDVFMDKTFDEIESLVTSLPGSKQPYIHLRCNIHHKVKAGSTIEAGRQAEIFVSQELQGAGIENQLSKIHYRYDILCANGCRIDVKSSNSPRHTSPKIQSNQWGFHIKPQNIKNCDVFVCVLPSKEFFVIPVNRIPKSLTLTFCWPTKRPKLHRYLDCYMNLESIKQFEKF